MATGNPCKSCSKTCVKNGGLPFNLIVTIGDDGCPKLDAGFLSSIRALVYALKILGCPCCLGLGIASHAADKVEQWFFYKLIDFFATQCQNGRWKDCIGQEVAIQLFNIDIKVDITCNDHDVSQGKGPPYAEVDEDSSSFQVNIGPCQPPNSGGGGGGGGGGNLV